MKKILFSCFILLSCFVEAQLSLSQSFNEPKPGEVENTYRMDTTAYGSGLPIGVAGNNVVWNFNNLKTIQPIFISNYLSASSVTSAASYTNCNLVEESSGVYTYFKSATTPTTQTELIGINTPSFTATFTNSGIVAKYPVNFGSSSSDNLSGSFTSTIAGNGTCSGNITTAADGTGTLNLPQNISLTNVLRVKSIQTITLTASFIPIGVLKQTVYNYYHSSQKFPVLSITYEYLTSIVSSTPNISSSVMGSTSYFVTGLKENMLESNAITLYPNPAQNNLIIELRNDLSLIGWKVYNQFGQLVLNSASTKVISLANLKSGIYYAEVVTDQGCIRKKIIKEE